MLGGIYRLICIVFVLCFFYCICTESLIVFSFDLISARNHSLAVTVVLSTEIVNKLE